MTYLFQPECSNNMANYKAFPWNFSLSTKPEITRSEVQTNLLTYSILEENNYKANGKFLLHHTGLEPFEGSDMVVVLYY